MKVTIGSKNVTQLGIEMEGAMVGDVDSAFATLVVNAILTLYRMGEEITYQSLKNEIGEFRSWEGSIPHVLSEHEFDDLLERNLLVEVPCYSTKKMLDLKSIAFSDQYPSIMYMYGYVKS